MNDIEKKALALLNEVRAERGLGQTHQPVSRRITIDEALCRAIEQHEAFRQEVSDAASAAVTLIETWVGDERAGKISADPLRRFIIAKPDPLERALRDAACDLSTDDFAEALRAAIVKHGGKIVWENSDA